MKIPAPLAKSAKLLLTLLLLFLVFRSVNPSKITLDLKSFRAGPLIVLLIAGWAGQLLCSERWRLFAASMQMPGSYRSFVQIYFAGMFFNIGLPSLIGGDAVKAYILSRKTSQRFQTGLASVLQDRAVGLVTLLAYGSLAILLSPLSWRGMPLWILYLLSWAGIGAALFLVFRGHRFFKFLLPPGQVLEPGAILRITAYSFIYSGLVLLIFQQVTAAAGHRVGIVSFSALFPLITLGTMLPVTLGGLGIREWLYVEALSLVGVPRDQALVISLATSALYLLVNLAGILFLPAIPRELRPHAFSFQANRTSSPGESNSSAE
ncbi:MAG: putative integral rane protein [Acidobacteria bacterium]|nr:putative integral rane protein [Acidobacteriota bacterium]